jgi:hypothetical protein
MVPSRIYANLGRQTALPREKRSMTIEQYENFMDILRKTKRSRWTSEKLNFIVGSKSINILKPYYSNVHQDKPKLANTDGTDTLQLLIDTYLVKDSSYMLNVTQHISTVCRGLVVCLGISLDTRQTLGKHPVYEDRDHNGTHTHTSPTKKETSSYAPQPREMDTPPQFHLPTRRSARDLNQLFLCVVSAVIVVYYESIKRIGMLGRAGVFFSK